MGQKVNPIGFRLGIYRTWDSRWFAGKEYSDFVLEDYKIRKFLKKRLVQAGVSKIEIERAADKIRIKIHTARPGLVIGKKGAEIENVKRDLEKQIKKEAIIDIQEVRKPEVDAQLIAENVALQLVRRISFRRAMKKKCYIRLEVRGTRYKDSLQWSIGGRRNGPSGVVSKRKGSPSYPESRHRLWLCRGFFHLWCHRCQGLNI